MTAQCSCCVGTDTPLSTVCISLQITFWSAGLLLPSWWERCKLKLTTTSCARALSLSNHEWRPTLFWWHLLSFHCLFWNVKPWLFQNYFGTLWKSKTPPWFAVRSSCLSIYQRSNSQIFLMAMYVYGKSDAVAFKVRGALKYLLCLCFYFYRFALRWPQRILPSHC